MFKLVMGIAFLVSAFVLAMTGVGAILAIPLGIIGAFMVIYVILGGIAKGGVVAAKAGASLAKKKD